MLVMTIQICFYSYQTALTCTIEIFEIFIQHNESEVASVNSKPFKNTAKYSTTEFLEILAVIVDDTSNVTDPFRSETFMYL